MVSQTSTSIKKMTSLYSLRLSTRGKWVVKKVKNSVYLVIEWPHIGRAGAGRTKSLLVKANPLTNSACKAFDERQTFDRSLVKVKFYLFQVQ